MLTPFGIHRCGDGLTILRPRMEKKLSDSPCVRGLKVENAKEMKEACRTMAEIKSLEACHRRFLPDPVKKRGFGETDGSDAYSLLGPGTGMSLLVRDLYLYI